MASFYLFPSPPTKGFLWDGKSFLIEIIILALITQVCFSNSFFMAGKNSYGSVIKAPSILVCFLMYYLEKPYKGNDLMVNQNILYPLL